MQTRWYDDIAATTRIIGRRNMLRYGFAGVIAATAAAVTGCGSTSARKQAVTAFAKGTWTVEIAGVGHTLVIDADKYEFRGTAPAETSHTGTWSLNGSTVVVTPAKYSGFTGSGVPSEVSSGTDATLTWSGSGEADRPFSLPVSWDGTTLTITGHKASSSGSGMGAPMTITAKRT